MLPGRVSAVAVVFALLPAACGGRGPAPAPAPSAPPAILFISVDTLRADRLNAYGYTRRRVSQHLDALARDGVLFEAHQASAPWTTPSHMTMFTGLDPSQHGVMGSARIVNNGLKVGTGYPILGATVPTFPEVLQQLGWSTTAFTGGRTVHPRLGFGRGFDFYDVSMHKVNAKKQQRIKDWVDGQSGRSFLLFWHTFEVHAPYTRTDFLAEEMPPAAAQALAADIEVVARVPGRKFLEDGILALRKHGAWNARVCSALYDGGVLHADRAIGEIVDHLKRAGRYDATMIVVTSDHGEQLGERNGLFYNAHGHTNYEEMIRVPLIVKLPGQAHAGRRVARVTRALDLAATMLDVVAQRPKHGAGVTLRALWEVPPGTDREAVTEATNDDYEIKSLREGRFKYIVTGSREQFAQVGRAVPADPQRRELYDLHADPGEARDMLAAADNRARTLAARMEERLRARTSVGPAGPAAETPVTGEMLEELRALGYVQ